MFTFMWFVAMGVIFWTAFQLSAFALSGIVNGLLLLVAVWLVIKIWKEVNKE